MKIELNDNIVIDDQNCDIYLPVKFECPNTSYLLRDVSCKSVKNLNSNKQLEVSGKGDLPIYYAPDKHSKILETPICIRELSAKPYNLLFIRISLSESLIRDNKYSFWLEFCLNDYGPMLHDFIFKYEGSNEQY